MNNLLLTTIWLGLLATTSASAASISRINGVEGLELCKQQIETSAGQAQLQFQRQSASSLHGSAFTYWINANSNRGEERGPMRYRCEISRNGEVLEVVKEGGRWNI